MPRFKNAKIVLEDHVIENGWLEIDNDIIKAIGSGDCHDGTDLKNQWVLPGFIDCHVHGGYGTDFETGDENRFSHFAENVVKEGITSYVQASVTNSQVKQEKCLAVFAKFLKSDYTGARCLGLHLEGPFLSLNKKGAHDPKLILKPDLDLLNRWNKLVNNHIRIVTYAPEEQDGSFTKGLLQNRIIPSAGHSVISAEQFDQEYNRGIRHVTHLFNAMSGFDHYHPGLALGALVHRDVLVEVISDGIHLAPEILKFIYQTKGANNICIITDAINAKGLEDGDYFLGELAITKQGRRATLKGTTTLAGACSTYDYNVRFYQKTCQIPMVELIKMTSINIAKQLGIFGKTGSISINKRADLVVLNDELEVQKTIVDGQVVYEREE